MPDYHDIISGVLGGPAVPGHVTFEVTWAGGGSRSNIKDDTYGFGGEFVGGPSTITFSVSDDGGGTVYTADKAGQGNGPLLPGVGHERNGVFYP